MLLCSQAITCSECGIEYALPGQYLQARIKDQRVWRCPNGHKQFMRKDQTAQESATVKELRQQLAQAIHRADQAEAKAAEASASIDKALEHWPELERPKRVRSCAAKEKVQAAKA